jgi:hypothetical protein
MAKTLWTADGHAATFFISNSYPVVQTTTGHKSAAFSDAADWTQIFGGVMLRGYAGGNVALYYHWASWTVTTGNCRWTGEFERLTHNGNRTDTLNFGTAQVTADAPGSTLSATRRTQIGGTLTPANISSIAAGDYFRIRAGRTGSNVADTMVGLAYLMRLELVEL